MISNYIYYIYFFSLSKDGRTINSFWCYKSNNKIAQKYASEYSGSKIVKNYARKYSGT
jgi:hypothetical protein